MGLVPFNNLGAIGVINEIPDHMTPMNAWTIANNITFRDSHVQSARGYSGVSAGDDSSQPLLARPQFLLPYYDPDSDKLFWIYPGIDDNDYAVIGSFDGDLNADRTFNPGIATIGTDATSPLVTTDDPHGFALGDTVVIAGVDDGTFDPTVNAAHVISDLTSTTSFKLTNINCTVASSNGNGTVRFAEKSSSWSGAIVNGLVAVNTNITVPQIWDRTAGVLDATFKPMTNWPADHTCAVMRGFRNFFIALDITDTTGNPDRNPYEVMHSGIVDSYTAPEWAPLTTNRAGSKYIGEGGGVLIDCLPLRGVNIIYSENEAWPMTWVGGNEVFAIGDKALLEYGMLTKGCAAAFGAGHHFVVTIGDVIIHDGANAQSVIEGKVRDSLFADMDTDNYVNTFVVSNYSEGEMWVCYPGSGHTYPNKIAKWNIATGAWSFQELPIETSNIKYGAVPEGGNDGVWDTDTEVWDLDDQPWNAGNYNPSVRSLMMTEIGTDTSLPKTIANSALLKADDSPTFDGNPLVVTLEKTGIIVSGMGSSGPVSDPTVDKFFYEVWPRAEGGPFNITLGTAQTVEGPYEWTKAQAFDPVTQNKLDFRPVEGRYGAIRFSSEDVSFHIDGFDLGIRTTGRRG